MNKYLLTAGLVTMVAGCLLLIFLNGINLRTGVGIFLLLVIGLCMTVAGSPDPNLRRDDVDPM